MTVKEFIDSFDIEKDYLEYQYIGYEQKVQIVEDLMEYDLVERNMRYPLALINAYTTIEADYTYVDYDLLAASDLMDYLLSLIPTREIDRFEELLVLMRVDEEDDDYDDN